MVFGRRWSCTVDEKILTEATKVLDGTEVGRLAV
jgi:hypothetical protein